MLTFVYSVKVTVPTLESIDELEEGKGIEREIIG